MAASLNQAAREIDNAYGLIDNRAVKSAQASARVFEKSGLGPIMPQVQDYGAERIQQAIESNRLLTTEANKVGNSARASAAVFAAAADTEEQAMLSAARVATETTSLRIQQAAETNRSITQQSSVIQNSARASASVFAAAMDTEEEAMLSAARVATETTSLRIQQAAETNRSITQQGSVIQNSARESAAVFDAAFEEMERSDASFTSQFINKSALRKTAIFDEAAAMQGHASSSQRASMGVRSLNVGQAAGSKAASRFGLVMQQSGYQVQDFAVQVAGGQNALVAFSQQGSQLLGIFGGWGAVAGAALSVGVLAYKMYDLSDSTSQSKESLDKVAEAIKRVNDATNESDFNRMTLPQQGTKIKSDIVDTKASLHKLRLYTIFNSDEKKGVSLLEQKESLQLKLIELGDKELANKLEIRRVEREAYDARVALAKKMESEIDTAINAAKTASRARLNVTGTELDKLKADMQDATFLTNSKDQGEQAQGWSIVSAIKAEVDAIKNQIDPMRERRKEQERYNALVLEGLLEQTDLDKLNKIRADKTVLDLQSRIPQSMRIGQGVMSSGLVAGAASPNALIDINRQILEGIRKLVSLESIGANGYN